MSYVFEPMKKEIFYYHCTIHRPTNLIQPTQKAARLISGVALYDYETNNIHFGNCRRVRHSLRRKLF